MSVDVLLMNGHWFEVPNANRADLDRSGALIVRRYDASLARSAEDLRVFGPGSWVTWTEKVRGN